MPIDPATLGEHYYRLLATDTLNQMSNYSPALQIPLDSKPHAAGAQRANLTLQELQMNSSAATGFAGRNTAFREYLLPICRG